MKKFCKVFAALSMTILAIGCAGAATKRSQQTRQPVIVGYFPQWGLYSDKPFSVKALLDSGGAALLNQINYAQGFVKDGRCSVADPNADLNTAYTAANSVSGEADDHASKFRGYYHQLKELKQKYPKLKLLISLEGRAQDFAFDAKPENREAFVKSCMDIFARGQFTPGVEEPGLFDGFDIDWESPHQEDARNFEDLLRDFRKSMSEIRPGMKLSIAAGHSPRMLAGVNFHIVAPLVDQIGVMNYDYVGPWMQRSGLIAPLFAANGRGTSIDRGMADYLEAGVPSEKLLMGIPFYGYGWKVPEGDHHGLFQPGPGVRGDRPYNEIENLKGRYILYRDELSRAPWLYDGDTFWTYEDSASVRYKANYVTKRGLGGVMIWELSGDSSDGQLMKTIHQSFRHPVEWYRFDSRSDDTTQEIKPPTKTSVGSLEKAPPTAN